MFIVAVKHPGEAKEKKQRRTGEEKLDREGKDGSVGVWEMVEERTKTERRRY